MQFGLKNKQNHCEMIYYINCPNNHKHKHLYLKYICICIGQLLDKHRFHRGGLRYQHKNIVNQCLQCYLIENTDKTLKSSIMLIFNTPQGDKIRTIRDCVGTV